MSTQSPYLKAIIIFPLVTQLIGSIIAYVAFGMDYCKEGNFDAVLFGFFLLFVLEGSVILAIYTTIFLSLLLPKSK